MHLTLKNISSSRSEPTFIFEIKNWLDQDRFAALDQSFPQQTKAAEVKNKKFVFSRYSKGYRRFLNNNSYWKQFLNDLTSHNFLQECNDLYNEHYENHEKWEHSGNFISNMINQFILGRTLVDVKTEFSFMSKGAFIVPHTDAARKLMTLMLYFPTSDDATLKKNGTKFWQFRPEDAKRYSNFENRKYVADAFSNFDADAECVYQTKFVKNHLYGFLKSDLSWHSVERIELKDGDSRNSVNININSVHAFGLLSRRAKSLRNRLKIWVHRTLHSTRGTTKNAG